MTVTWARRSLGMVLDREYRLVPERKAAIGAVEQRDVSLDRICRQARAVHRETVIHRGDLDLAGREILHRMVCAMVTLVHFYGLAADRDRQHLMTEADAEGRHLVDERVDDRYGIFAGRGRIAGPVGKKDAVGLERQDIGRRRLRR